MSKVILKKYQRRLVPYFHKYSLCELEGDRDMKVISTERLGSTAQSLLEGDQREAVLKLEKKREMLLEVVQERFKAIEGEDRSRVDPTDLAILYEVTGY